MNGALRLVVMGVAASGKSTLAKSLAQRHGWVYLEGDAFHDDQAVSQMAQGHALTDDQRWPWLRRLARAMAATQGPAVLSASLLRRAHRDHLRADIPGLRLVHLQLPLQVAQVRCASRGADHFFSPALVANQFDVLEPTDGEPDVLGLDAQWPLDELQSRALAHFLP